jgi:hydroxymethylpyrimidine/phosphomethylpyrimidine kinase
MIIDQIDAVISDIGTDAVKIGMLASADMVELVASKLTEHELGTVVLDPVMVATSGDRLMAVDAVDSLKESLLPLASLVTPNLEETAVLTGHTVENLADMKDAAMLIHAMGPRTVLIKRGTLCRGRVQAGYEGEDE